ncbi:TraR/DksA family transcriptional regulator [Aquicoccus porphyridii]|uniref:TraR/DksA family transcriptional regulator n=1 Tax=Aquicoccus porphyridii TaxID=1852029 RepID=A0A5A9ZSI7_9RHOB|nr:TraR/DksA C4-type zinc finger protein [Aquicoccus porphyridii]KAA0920268.1 TraR/DksA family transcriptional regulator [Aquicoccus porphyridii]RAI55106.1 TraR/DksA family transcriptional regulator [Rhodobacteraceae bacterium AsT-22]
MKSYAKYRALLLTRLSELDQRLHEIEEELDAHQSKDWEELATEREDDEVLEGLGLAGQEEIRRIRAALQRIRDGEYGICTKCGEQIPEARLDVLPYTPFCKTCAASL